MLAELEPKSDYQVLMVQGPPALAKRLAEAYPGFDIVVATSEYDDVLKHDAEMLNGDKTMLVSVGRKGKYVGVFGLYPKEIGAASLSGRDLGQEIRRPGDGHEER